MADEIYHGICWYKVEAKLEALQLARKLAAEQPKFTVAWVNGWPALSVDPDYRPPDPPYMRAVDYINCLMWGVDEGAFLDKHQ